MIKNIKWLLLVSLTFVACNDDDETTAVEVPITAGSADFSKYVALGNSITAGYSDGALFIAGQSNAYPKLMADQFALAGGGTFTTPFMSDNAGGIVGLPLSSRLVFNGCSPVPLGGTPTTPLLPALTGPFNNMGVPGAKSFHLLAPGYGNPGGLPASANPYFVRFASSGTTSIIADAMTQQPTFFSLWIGNNDVLGYATTGGDGTNPITPITGAPGVGFDGTYNALVETLTGNGAKGVIANIPYVNSVPFFTTITVKPVAPYTYYSGPNQPDAGQTDCSKTYAASANDIAQINAINSGVIGPVKQLLSLFQQGDRLELLSTTSNNPLLIVDESLTDMSANITLAAQGSGNPQLIALAPYLGATFGKARHTKTGDYIPLTTKGVIGTNATLPPGVPASLGKYGITYPLQDKHILIPTEVEEIRLATDSYNATILAAANAKGLAFVDANAVMNQLANGGIRFENYHFTSAFVQGGAFGLDGVHLTARANAYIANKFLESINAKYGSTLRMYKPQDFVISYPSFLP